MLRVRQLGVQILTLPFMGDATSDLLIASTDTLTKAYVRVSFDSIGLSRSWEVNLWGRTLESSAQGLSRGVNGNGGKLRHLAELGWQRVGKEQAGGGGGQTTRPGLEVIFQVVRVCGISVSASFKGTESGQTSLTISHYIHALLFPLSPTSNFPWIVHCLTVHSALYNLSSLECLPTPQPPDLPAQIPSVL